MDESVSHCRKCHRIIFEGDSGWYYQEPRSGAGGLTFMDRIGVCNDRGLHDPETARDEEERIRRALIDGLVGPHRHLYRTSVSFKAAIDSMAFLMPMWINGMAAVAAQERESIAERIEAAMAGPDQEALTRVWREAKATGLLP